MLVLIENDDDEYDDEVMFSFFVLFFHSLISQFHSATSQSVNNTLSPPQPRNGSNINMIENTNNENENQSNDNDSNNSDNDDDDNENNPDEANAKKAKVFCECVADVEERAKVDLGLNAIRRDSEYVLVLLELLLRRFLILLELVCCLLFVVCISEMLLCW